MFILAAAALTCTMCCKQTRSTAETKAGLVAEAAKPITTGIAGRIEVWEGNFMPPIEPERRTNQIKPGAARRVRVHEPVKIEGGLASSKRETIATPLVAEVMADSAGRFTISVPPGTYSIFVEEDGGWYYNGWSEKGIQGEVSVEDGKLTEAVIKITTKATF
jgi:hypothetical protein